MREKCRGIVKGSQYTAEQYKILLDEKWSGEYVLLSEFTKCGDQHLYKHSLCGSEFLASHSNLRRLPVPCPECCPPELGVAKRRRITVGGREFRVQGKENIALPYVWDKLGCPIEDILYLKRDMPKLEYEFMGKVHRCYPDFYLPSKNMLVEVKDRNSLGLMDRSKFFGKNIFSRNCEKIRSATRAGFTIKLVLVAGKTVKTLPKGWYKLDKEKVKQIAM